MFLKQCLNLCSCRWLKSNSCKLLYFNWVAINIEGLPMSRRKRFQWCITNHVMQSRNANSRIQLIPFINDIKNKQYVESVRIQSFSGPYFLAFELNMETYGVSLRIQPKCGKMQIRKPPITDTFLVVEKVLEIFNSTRN